ncbi:uncharacterized protein EDB91DRAFT_1245511 [Suillus paluster]|uniref:uncharacterized protein n=1 Tax=Suillus paluster TaxID=48578 RepID=UPI001B880E2A|nr:uncharacterized protein EDB91DRAFT_1245511 [Suillus paluster]KAG1747067.1 hypothetical protein EDB91DRAFT_1245511 [Suillus paluster]
MQAIEGTTANSKESLPHVSDIIGALQNILARSQVIIPDLETPYSRFPNTDQSTIPEGQSLIDAIITERQQQVNAVLHEISGLETVMDGVKNVRQQLVEKKDSITQSMDLHKGLVSVLWRIPTEVLSHIFVHCLPEAGCLSPASNLACIMLLTRICRGWREVAVGVPNLWCRLYIKDRDLQRATFFYDSWLKRSRGYPLSLELDCHANDSTKLKSLLQPYINQISSLSIKFSRTPDQPELLLNDLPALQELTIAGIHHIPSIAQSISRLPSTLRSLHVMESWFDVEHLSSLNAVWAHLTNVEINIVHPNVFLHLLQLCPNLSSLTVRADFDQIRTLEPFTHTEIRSLRTSPVTLVTRPLTGLFDALTLPNLRVFEAGYVRTWPHEEFKAFLVRSKCPLESLNVNGYRSVMTAGQRAEYAVLFPSLEVVAGSEF